jgi:hypothetical protein
VKEESYVASWRILVGCVAYNQCSYGSVLRNWTYDGIPATAATRFLLDVKRREMAARGMDLPLKVLQLLEIW